LALVSLHVALARGAEATQIILDGGKEGRVFEGIGALSAGASSRLLIEYPEPARSQVLDYLFRPNYGAGFQHLKVEIGGDVNSTDGCEPSHMHTRRDENYQRGYEWWLMKEAKRRNPGMLLDCLEWGAPGWIGNGYFNSRDNAEYIARFIIGARRVHGLEFDYTGIWNETRADTGFVKLLRETLDRRGLNRVEIVAADDINRWTLAEALARDAELARAVAVIGVHYPKYQSTPAAQACGKRLWASEDGPWRGNWVGAGALAKQYNRNYIEGRMTKTIIWSPVTAYYDVLPLPGSGAMRANAPWSGHYDVQPAIWATAHTTQFARPGWRYVEGGACRLLAAGGSCVALRAPDGTNYSLIIETIDATRAEELSVEIKGGLWAATPVHVWRSSATELFVRREDVLPAGNRFSLTLEPGCIYSLTTTAGQAHGEAVSPPPAAFPKFYREDFENYAVGTTPRYFMDQAGIFAVARRALDGGKCLRQVVPGKGIEWPFHLDPYPETVLGDANWRDYEVRVEALIEKAGFVSLFGRIGLIEENAHPPGGYWLKVDSQGYWELGTMRYALASGRVKFAAGVWHALGLRFQGPRVTVEIDGTRVSEVSDSTYPTGLVGLGCGWHGARFDGLEIRVDADEQNLALGKRATASSESGVDVAANVTDGDFFTTCWTAASGKGAGEWVRIDLEQATRVNAVVVRQREDHIKRGRVQWWTGTDWANAAEEAALTASPQVIRFPPVTARCLRLLVTEAQGQPSLWELAVESHTRP
jgi:galactosylceramidase